VLYRGHAYVKLAGDYRTQISGAQLDVLAQAFKRANFCHRRPTYPAHVTDTPEVRITFEPREVDGTDCPNRSVQHEEGSLASPDVAALETLEDEVECVVQIERFVGGWRDGRAARAKD
jgi:hypothetical protein